MKTIRVDGRTYAAVEVDENITCKGCIFYTVGWDLNTPRCTAVNTPRASMRCRFKRGRKERDI